MTAPTTDNRPTDTIRDAFEAMIAFLTILIVGPMPRAWPDIAAVAARAIGSQARTTEEAERAVAAIAALRDLIQRAAEEHSRPQIEPAAAADTWPPTRIAEALERCERATPGPWLSEAGWNNAGMPSRTWKVPGRNDGLEIEMLAGDALFVEHARTDLPSALRALATAQGRLQHAHDSANRLYQAAREVVANAEHVACTRHNDVNQQIFVTPGAGLWIDAMTLGVLRAAIDPTEEAAALAEVQRRDGLAAEIERLRDDRDEARRDRDALAAKVETMIGVTAEAKPLDPSDKAAIAASWERAKQAPACTGPNKRGAS